MKNTFLAIDLGATSGRSVLGTLHKGKLTMEELTRFPNQIITKENKRYWNLTLLFNEIKKALVECVKKEVVPETIGIDTWGVDFVYFDKEGCVLDNPRSYRDPYSTGMAENYLKEVSQTELYQQTGIQVMDINSLFQLYAAKEENFDAYNKADFLLFMPDALGFLLTGNVAYEYTISSTSQLLNPITQTFAPALLEKVAVQSKLVKGQQNPFGKTVLPGTVLGRLKNSIAEEVGIPQLPIISVAGHDTASAVMAIPALDQNFAYLSSGTWSLLGIEIEQPILNEAAAKENFTNEGGAMGNIRFLKNICGMWLLEECRRIWEQDGHTYTYPEIVELCKKTTSCGSLIYPDDSSFTHPDNMVEAIQAYCRKTKQVVPETDGEIIRVIFESLAQRYRDVIEKLETFAPFKIERLHVIGGGAKNKLLNQWIANAIQRPVFAGPVEGAAMGNLLMQAKALGYIKSGKELREVVQNSTKIEQYNPE